MKKKIAVLDVDSYGQQKLIINKDYTVKAIIPEGNRRLLINVAKD